MKKVYPLTKKAAEKKNKIHKRRTGKKPEALSVKI